MKKAIFAIFSVLVITIFAALVFIIVQVSSMVPITAFSNLVQSGINQNFTPPQITGEAANTTVKPDSPYAKKLPPLAEFKGTPDSNNVFSAPLGFALVIPNEQPEEKGIIAFTVSAAGDCTLGSDASASGSGSFVAEVAAQNNDYTYFLKHALPYFEDDDLTIVNFEGTLSQNGARQNKQYAFRGAPEYVNILTSSSVEAVNLANNHTMDYGEIAFNDTKRIMDENGILWFEGENLQVAEINGIKVGFIGSSLLTYEGKRDFVKNITALKAHEPNLIIASFHWGTERMYAPTAIQKQYARLAIDNGADLVIGHHPHVLQPIERYKGKYILYSLGNFCFGGNKNPSDKDSMIFTQTFCFENGNLLPDENVSVIPFSVSSQPNRNNYQPTPLWGEEFQRVKDKILGISAGYEGIDDITFVEGPLPEQTEIEP